MPLPEVPLVVESAYSADTAPILVTNNNDCIEERDPRGSLALANDSSLSDVGSAPSIKVAASQCHAGTAEKRPLGPTRPAHGTAAAPRDVYECARAPSRRAVARRRGFAATAALDTAAAQKE